MLSLMKFFKVVGQNRTIINMIWIFNAGSFGFGKRAQTFGMEVASSSFWTSLSPGSPIQSNNLYRRYCAAYGDDQTGKIRFCGDSIQMRHHHKLVFDICTGAFQWENVLQSLFDWHLMACYTKLTSSPVFAEIREQDPFATTDYTECIFKLKL